MWKANIPTQFNAVNNSEGKFSCITSTLIIYEVRIVSARRLKGPMICISQFTENLYCLRVASDVYSPINENNIQFLPVHLTSLCPGIFNQNSGGTWNGEFPIYLHICIVNLFKPGVSPLRVFKIDWKIVFPVHAPIKLYSSIRNSKLYKVYES